MKLSDTVKDRLRQDVNIMYADRDQESLKLALEAIDEADDADECAAIFARKMANRVATERGLDPSVKRGCWMAMSASELNGGDSPYQNGYDPIVAHKCSECGHIEICIKHTAPIYCPCCRLEMVFEAIDHEDD